MSTDEPFRTDYEFLKGVDYIFVSLDRNLSGEECHELAYRKPLANVTPQFRAVSKGHTFTPQR